MATKEVITGKIPPQNIDAEKSLLGAVLIDEETLADISEHVTAKDFYEKRHSIIYDGMMRLYEKHRPVDLLTLTDELKRKKELEVIGGSAYLTELTNYVPTAAHLWVSASIRSDFVSNCRRPSDKLMSTPDALCCSQITTFMKSIDAKTP